MLKIPLSSQTLKAIKNIETLKEMELQKKLESFEELNVLLTNIIDEREGIEGDSPRAIELDNLYMEVDSLLNLMKPYLS